MPTTTIPTISRLIVTTLLLLSVFLFSASAQASEHISVSHTADDFVTKWRIPDGDTAARTIIFPGTGNYEINWGDDDDGNGVIDESEMVSNSDEVGSISHIYRNSGDYTVVVSKVDTTFDIDRFNLWDEAIGSKTFRISNAEKLIDVQQWGKANWSSMENAFRSSNLGEITAEDTPDLSRVSNMQGMFFNASLFNGNIGGWNVSTVTNMISMFRNASIFNQDIGRWDVSSVANMRNMFSKASIFNQDIGEWDVSSVTDMGDMFSMANKFKQNLGRWYINEDIDNNDGTLINYHDTGPDVLTFNFAAENSFLRDHRPLYGLVGDHESFLLIGKKLRFRRDAAADGTYIVRISITTNSFSNGNGKPVFGTNNTLDLTVVIGEPTVDNTAPMVTSIERTTPPDAVTNANSLTWTVTFSEDVQGVDNTDFMVSGASGVSLVVVETSATVYTVEASGGDLATFTGNVTLGFVVGQEIEDTESNRLTDTTPTTGTNETYTLDNTAPTVTIARSDGLETSVSGDFDVTFTFNEDVTGFDVGDIEVTNGEIVSDSFVGNLSEYIATITPQLSPALMSGETITVTVLADPANGAQDTAGNGNAVSNTLVVVTDTTAPTVTSIVRTTPSNAVTNADTLVWTVTFSEDVNVDGDDFAITDSGTSLVVPNSWVVESINSNRAIYAVTASGGDLATFNGDVTLGFASGHTIAGTAGNRLTDTV
ncbi:MAG: BspA family leucine-rich repeat surface protein, partial [Methylococcales symbiont of Hymedesmia sp. n. MRB-2018]